MTSAGPFLRKIRIFSSCRNSGNPGSSGGGGLGQDLHSIYSFWMLFNSYWFLQKTTFWFLLNIYILSRGFYPKPHTKWEKLGVKAHPVFRKTLLEDPTVPWLPVGGIYTLLDLSTVIKSTHFPDQKPSQKSFGSISLYHFCQLWVEFFGVSFAWLKGWI